MKNEDLLKAIGQIDDELIEAAETKRDSKKIYKMAAGTAGAKRGGAGRVVFKSLAAVAACLVLVIGIGSATGAFRMGSAKSQAADSEAAYYDGGFAVATAEAPKAEEMYATNQAVMDMDYVKEKSSLEVGNSGVFEPLEVARTQKLVYRAYLDVQTTDFDKAAADLASFVESFGGYFENSSVSNGSYFNDNVYKNGYYVVRVPAEKYQDFMNAACGTWHVANKNENVDDITKAYYELSDRITTLEIKEEKLHELLKKATALGDIIELENQLSNNEYELNQLKNNLAGYDEQVNYTTIEINLCQVTQMGSQVGGDGFGARLVRALKNGITNFGEGIADFIVWIGYNVIEIVIAIAVILLIRKFHLFRKLINWIKR